MTEIAIDIGIGTPSNAPLYFSTIGSIFPLITSKSLNKEAIAPGKKGGGMNLEAIEVASCITLVTVTKTSVTCVNVCKTSTALLIVFKAAPIAFN